MSLNVCDLARKMMANFGFSAPVRFRGHFEEIGIASVLLKTKPPRHVGKFRDVGFLTSEKVWHCGKRKKKENKLSAKYNGSLALTTLERATITRKIGISDTLMHTSANL